MPMLKTKPAANPDACVAALHGWRREIAEAAALNVKVGNPTLTAK